jgi:hypothetical protein
MVGHSNKKKERRGRGKGKRTENPFVVVAAQPFRNESSSNLELQRIPVAENIVPAEQ